MTALELVACAALGCTSAWLSASEIALFSLSRFQLRSLKEKFRPSHRKIKRLLSDPSGLLITILVANEMVMIGLSSIVTKTVAQTPKPRLTALFPLPLWMIDTILGLLLTTPIVLIVCEITPKVVASRANRLIAPMTAGPLSALYDTFKPIRIILNVLVSRVAALTTPKTPARNAAATDGETDMATAPDSPSAGKLLRESDFLLMVEEGHKEGAVQQGELELIKNVFELDDTTVAEVFTPLPQVQTLTERTTLRSALNMMRSQKYSRIPITATAGLPSRREVVGVLYSKDLLKARLQPELMTTTVDGLMRKPLFVNSSMRLNTLFRKFKQQKTHMAVVQGPMGEALGIVTMSDVLDTLFEDILVEDEEVED